MVDCRDCRKYVYDFDTGERKTYRAGPRREERPMLRPGTDGPPCEKCPMESPQKAHEHLLSRRNWETFRLYQQVRATGGACLNAAERQDPLLAHNLALIDNIYRQWEAMQLATHVALAIPWPKLK